MENRMNKMTFFTIILILPKFGLSSPPNSELNMIWQEVSKYTLDELAIEDFIVKRGEEGFFEAKSFEITELSHRIVEIDPSLSNFDSEAKEKIRKFDEVYRRTMNSFYSGSNLKTKTIEVETGWGDRRTIDDLVRANGFLPFINSWWSGGKSFADISSDTSRSPLKELIGPGATREIFWPGTPTTDPVIRLDAARFSVLKEASGKIKAIEVIARNTRKFEYSTELFKGWEPFLYEKVWGRWIPMKEIRGMPVKTFCIQCHQTSTGEFSPFPTNLDSDEDLRNVGYKNESIIHELMKFKEVKK